MDFREPNETGIGIIRNRVFPEKTPQDPDFPGEKRLHDHSA